jgi:hypothetical protein
MKRMEVKEGREEMGKNFSKEAKQSCYEEGKGNERLRRRR